MRREAFPGSTPELAPLAWFRSAAHLHVGPPHENTLAEESFEALAAEWIFVAVWTAGAYYGITLTAFAWYWPVGFGFVVGFATYKLLRGPLRGVLSGVRRSYLLAAILGAVALFLLQVHV